MNGHFYAPTALRMGTAPLGPISYEPDGGPGMENFLYFSACGRRDWE